MQTKFPSFVAMLLLAAACTAPQTVIPLSDGERVWGCRIKDGSAMPFPDGFSADGADNAENQVNPLLLTSEGRYVWSETPFRFRIDGRRIVIDGTAVVTEKPASDLAGAFRAASERFFPADGTLPPAEFYRMPQYNTWIELMYDQNQEGVLQYARGILDHGLPPGILMIDDTWQADYGRWEFEPGRFPDPKAMVDALHGMGFKVMLWVCPFVSMDQYLVCRDIMSFKGFLLSGAPTWAEASDPYPVRWWNGTSAVLDFSNAESVAWFDRQLQRLMDDYGIDGFKFDAADFGFYPSDALACGGDVPGYEQCSRFVELARKYPYNELRAGWRHAGEAVVQRLHDKEHSWADLGKLIPEMLAEGLMGYAFSCPDMVGGGSFQTFLDGETDPDLVVRSAQVHALMPMMQFSLAPWRVLDAAHYQAVLKAVSVRESLMDVIEALYLHAAETGDPVVRPLEYVFPHQGFATVTDQFMLGDSILVAPMLTPGTTRTVLLPEGTWCSDDGVIYEGGSHDITVPLNRLPYFKKQ